MNVMVTGAGGFIGGHLVAALLKEGHDVFAVDIKDSDRWERRDPRAQNFPRVDLRDMTEARHLFTHLPRLHHVYNLAADMGGMGFIETHKIDCMRSVLINTNMLELASTFGVDRFFFSSSACVYAAQHQETPDVTPLAEWMAYPAQPEDGYGWEKLFSERLCMHYDQEVGLATRVARYHNVYGPHGSWIGGREKAPAALCRKVAWAKMRGDGDIEIWGDGEQTRSFMYIDDCIRGTIDIMNGEHPSPVNLGSAELVSINQLVSVIEDIAQVKLKRVYNLDAPKGVRGRNSDNALFRQRHGWEPSIPLQIGLARTYEWVAERAAGLIDNTVPI